jgi:hypothetical protein
MLFKGYTARFPHKGLSELEAWLETIFNRSILPFEVDVQTIVGLTLRVVPRWEFVIQGVENRMGSGSGSSSAESAFNE